MNIVVGINWDIAASLAFFFLFLSLVASTCYFVNGILGPPFFSTTSDFN